MCSTSWLLRPHLHDTGSPMYRSPFHVRLGFCSHCSSWTEYLLLPKFGITLCVNMHFHPGAFFESVPYNYYDFVNHWWNIPCSSQGNLQVKWNISSEFLNVYPVMVFLNSLIMLLTYLISFFFHSDSSQNQFSLFCFLSVLTEWQRLLCSF